MKHYKLTLFTIIILLGMVGCKEEPPLPNTLETLKADADLTLFVEMIDYADLEEVFSASTIITVLAPVNDAVDSFLVEEGYDAITDIPQDVAAATVLYHLQQGSALEENLSPGYYLTPASWKDNLLAILIDELNGDLAFNRRARIVQSDILALNGVIHKVDAVLPIPNILDFLENNTQFDLLVEAINRGGLRSLFTSNGPYTLFAPPDAAFENYFDIKSGVINLDDLTDEQLKNIVLNHTLSGNYRLSDFSNSLNNDPFPNLYPNGSLRVSVPFKTALVNDTVATLLMDIQGTNGVMHIVDGVIEP